MTNRQAIRRYYDRIGRGQVTQAFYEDPATERLLQHGDWERADAVIELGCGTGRFAEKLLRGRLPPAASYRGFDLSGRMIDLATARLRAWADHASAQQTDGEPPLPVGDGAADRFVATYVLDLMSRDEAQHWLAEAQRVLAPGGLLCLVCITQGTGRISRFVSDTWTSIWRRRPTLVGGCRPIELLDLLPGKDWAVAQREVVTAWAVASEVVLARRV